MDIRSSEGSTLAEMRPTGIDRIGNVPWGTHLCAFYQDPSDLIDIIAPYFRAGLEAGDQCLWVMAKPWELADAVRRLRNELPDVEGLLASGQLRLVKGRDWYLKHGEFAEDRMTALWAQAADDAVRQGFAGLRAAADEAWLTKDFWSVFGEYEAHLGEALASVRIVCICAYLLTGSTGVQVFDVARRHDYAIARRDGEWQVLETTGSLGSAARLQREVAARTRELREREALYRFLAENSDDIVTLTDMDRRRVYASPAFKRVLGYLPDQVFGGVHPEDLPAIQAAWRAIKAGDPRTVIFRHRHADGSWRLIEGRGNLVDYRGEPHMLAVMRDVTDRVQLEDELRQAQKMEALGRLASGVTHDFRNLLTAIGNYAYMAAVDLPAGSPARDHVEAVGGVVQRAQALTRQLLDFSRRRGRDHRIIDLRQVVAEMEPMLRVLMRDHIDFEVRAGARELLVCADPARIEQAVMNLAVNARDACRGEGRIVIECGEEQAGPPRSEHPAYVKPGDYAMLRITDTGVGMTPKERERAFEPFFTTKPPGLGTGLGLSTVFGIVKEARGFVWAKSKPGEGSTFTVLLPMQPQGAECPEPAKALSA